MIKSLPRICRRHQCSPVIGFMVGSVFTFIVMKTIEMPQHGKTRAGSVSPEFQGELGKISQTKDSEELDISQIENFAELNDENPKVENYGNMTFSGQVESIMNSIREKYGNQDVATLLATHIRVLCMIITTKRYHKERAAFVKRTWGKQCTKLVFISDTDDPDLPAISITSKVGWNDVWYKTRGGFQWAYDNHLNDFDWFMKADDDTFYIMENLRALLAQFRPSYPAYLGHEFGKPNWTNPKSYCSGGAGYLLSRKALEKLVGESFQHAEKCKDLKPSQPFEDKELGKCLQSVGVYSSDSRDDKGRLRFFSIEPGLQMTDDILEKEKWIYHMEKYLFTPGPECCSDIAISFHKIVGKEMMKLDYLVNRIHRFGRNVFSDSSLANLDLQLAYNMVYKVLQENGLMTN